MIETIAFDSTRFVEEAIRDDFNTRFLAGLPRRNYRISADDFTAMVDRLSAKVEYGSPSEIDDFGYRPIFVTLHLGGGAARVSPARGVVSGTFAAVEVKPEEQIEPRLVDRLGEQLLKSALKALTDQRDYGSAAMLVHAFAELQDVVIRASFGRPPPAGLETGAALREPR